MKISYTELKVKEYGYTIRGLFTEPDDGYDQVVVLLHGFTGHKNENGYLFKQITKVLVEHRMATLRYDYMGCGDSDGEFVEQTFNTVLADAKAAVDEGVRRNAGKPIYLIGFSMGGAAAARMSVERKDVIEKLVLMSPGGSMPGLLTQIFKNHPVIDGKYVDLGGYYVSKDFLDSFDGRDMYADVEKFEKEVLITQGALDTAVLPEISKKYAERYPNVYKYVLIEGSQHCYTKVPYRKIVQQEILEFLTKK